MPGIPRHLLTEASDFINTEASNRIILEQDQEITGTAAVSSKPGRWQYQSYFNVLLPMGPVFSTLQPIVMETAVRGKIGLSAAIMAGSCFMNPLPIPNPPAPTIDMWAGQHPDIIVRAKEERYTFPSLFRPEMQPLPRTESWLPQTDQKAREYPDFTYLTPEDFLWDGSLEADFSGQWQFQPDVPVERLDNRWTAPWEFRTEKIDLPASMWMPNTDQKAREFADLTYIVPFDWTWDGSLEADFSGQWQFQDVNPFERLDNRDFRGEYRVDVISAAVEVITLDKWYSPRPDILFRTKDPRYTYPSLFRPDNQPTPITDWLTPRPDILYKARDVRYTYQALFWPEHQPDVIITSWLGSRPDLLFRAKDFRHTYPSLFWPERQPDVLISSWLGNYPDVLFRAKNLKYLDPELFRSFVIGTPEVITIDKWLGSRPDILFRTTDRRYLDPNNFRSEFIVPPEVITMDKWFREIVQPWHLFARKHPEYLYPNGAFYVGQPINVSTNTRLIIVEGRLAYRVGNRLYVWL